MLFSFNPSPKFNRIHRCGCPNCRHSGHTSVLRRLCISSAAFPFARLPLPFFIFLFHYLVFLYLYIMYGLTGINVSLQPFSYRFLSRYRYSSHLHAVLAGCMPGHREHHRQSSRCRYQSRNRLFSLSCVAVSLR